MLHEFIAVNREEIVRRCRALAGTRSVPSPTEEEIDCGVPVLLDQLSDALRQLGYDLDREHFRNDFGDDGCLVAGSRPHFQNAFRTLQGEGLGHERDDVWL